MSELFNRYLLLNVRMTNIKGLLFLPQAALLALYLFLLPIMGCNLTSSGDYPGKANDTLIYIEQMPLDTISNPSKILIFLHGYGSNENDLLTLLPLLDSTAIAISPRGPYILGEESFHWFPINFSNNTVTSTDLKAARQSAKKLYSFVSSIKERKNKPAQHLHLYLVGFSQGAMLCHLLMAQDTGVINGIIAMAGNIDHETSETLGSKTDSVTRVFCCHGIYDEVVPYSQGKFVHQSYKNGFRNLTWKDYPTDHSITEQMVTDIKLWLKAPYQIKE